ncbi:MAG: sigma-E processing peptidase SpoIIGA [Firmicutes bacterium]|nr:sigma-E processing peptidase SpoIIGA [Bacillota bacterium]
MCIIKIVYVYIEYVIIDNLVITALIALASYSVLRVKLSKKRIAAASILGTIVAIFYPFMRFRFAFLLLIRVALAAILSFILFYKKSKLIKSAIVFLLVTATVGGLIFMVGFVISGDAVTALINPIAQFPIGLIFIIPLSIYFPIKKLTISIAKSRQKKEFNYAFEISVFDKTLSGTAFLDSGNMLFDDQSGLAVVVASERLCLKILSPQQIVKLAQGNEKQICTSARFITVNTIAGTNKLLLIKPQKFKLYTADKQNIIKDIMLALSFKNLGDNTDILLSPLVL